MKYALTAGTLLLAASAVVVTSASGAEVSEVAPGVYFRLADRGCNNGWVVFDDFVLLIDANFPDTAAEVLDDVRASTDLPVRFVLNTHHHGDHVQGNSVFARAGATIIAQRNCVETIAHRARQENSETLSPSLVFDDRMVFDDGTRRVEILHFGHAHTKGDAVAYLPKERILFTGDLCVNGAFNFMGESDSKNWIEVLAEIQELDVETVCPGHGGMAGDELLETQKHYFVELRKQVRDSIDRGNNLDETRKKIAIPGYKEWTGQAPREANIKHVYQELTGLITPWELVNLELTEGPSPTKDSSGWTPPRKMLTRGLDERKLADLRRVAPGVEFINVSRDEKIDQIADADAVMGSVTPEELQAAKKLRWVHSTTAGVERYLFPEFAASDVTLTNGSGMFGPAIADHVMGMILMFTKALAIQHERKLEAKWGQDRRQPITDLAGKTMLILGLGGIGKQIAHRAAGFNMTILAIEPQQMEKPRHVRGIYPPDELNNLLPDADIVVSCVPLTKHTFRYFGKQQFDLMKPTAYFINIGRGRTVVTEDLMDALRSKSISGAGLDVTDPEPLPADHPLWDIENVVITPHMSGRTQESWHRVWLLLRENVRRFAAGEPMLNVVNKQAGY